MFRLKCTAEREAELLGGGGTLPGSYNLKKLYINPYIGIKYSLKLFFYS
jgi:hypothetical protein